MISKSTITVTQADMQTALAYWLNATTMKEPVKVTNVETDKKGGNYGVEHFVVEVERADAKADPARSEP